MRPTSTATPPCTMVVSSKLTVTTGTGAALTISEADAVPLLPNDVVKSLVALSVVATVADVTSTVMSQVAPAAMVLPS